MTKFRSILLHSLISAAALLGGAQAASGCTSLYATVTVGGGTALDFVNTVTNTSSQTYSLPAAMTTLNGLALNPVNGYLYFIDRTGGINNLYSFNPATSTLTLVGGVTQPPGANNMVIGGTFDNSTASPRFYLFYGNYVAQEVNFTTGAVIRNITLNLPATDSEGNTLSKRILNGNPGTSGDMVFSGATAYAVLDTTVGGTNTSHIVTVGNLSSVTGTSLTVSNAKRMTLGGASMVTGTTNGLAIMPSGATYITFNNGSSNGPPTLGSVNINAAPTIPVTSLATNASRAYTDLSDCVVTPDTPTLTKSFGASTIYLNTSTTLTVNLGNTNPSPYYTNVAVTDTLPTGLVIAATPSLSTTCVLSDGTSGLTGATATAGSGALTLPSGLRVNPGGCSYTVNVTGQSSGTKNNVIPAGSVQSGAGNNATAATATLIVNGAITGTLVKQVRNVTTNGTLGPGPITAKPGEVLEYCLTGTHPGTGTADATSAVIRDDLSANLGSKFTLVSGAYAGNDIRIVRTGVSASTSYASFAASISAGMLSVSAMPFRSGASVQVCFQAQVRPT